MKHSKFLRYQEFLFDSFITTSYIIYILLAIGLLNTYPVFLSYLNNIVLIYTCFFILYRFNPFREIKCTSLDRKVIFSSGLFLLTTFVLTKSNLNSIKNFFITDDSIL